MRIKLLTKFVLVMGALSLIPMIYLALHLSQVSQKGIQASVLELHTELAGNLAGQIDSYLKVSDEKILFAVGALRQNMPWEQKQQILRSLIDTFPDVIDIAALNARGDEALKIYNPELSTGTALVNRAQEEGFRLASSEHRNVQIVSRSADGPRLLAYYPLTETVILRFAVSLRAFSELVKSKQVGGTGFAVIVDGKGAPLFYPPGNLSESDLASVPQWPIMAAARQSESLGSSEFRDAHGREWVGAYAPVPRMGWAAVILQPRDEAYFASIEMRRSARIAFIVVAFLALTASTFMARRLTSPLLSLTRAAEAVSHGTFDVAVSIKSRDEVQDLAETFNRMVTQLGKYAALQVDRLVAEQRKTKAILVTINDGILLTDNAARISLANARALNILVIDPAAAVEGKLLSEVAPASDLAAAVAKSAREAKPESFLDVAVGPEKSRSYWRVRSFPVTLNDAEVSGGIVTSVSDVTFQKELDKMKDDFFHHITHDLRNPLGSVMGFVGLLLGGGAGELKPEQADIITSMQRSLSRQMGLINNILDISKMESGKITVQVKKISPAEVAGRSIAILGSLHSQKNLTVACTIPPEMTLDGDGDLLERVITNILGNAIKYTPAKGAITISASDVDGGKALRFCVTDTGPGIPKNYLTRVFEKFEQVTETRSGGTGLGLTITKAFVEAHLGRIWVESELGKGSQFYFDIPRNLRVDASGAVVLGA